jgi:eukaryotic-like serine/threonine-protein kinase
MFLAQATTSSLEALKAYSLGGKAHNEKGPAAALPYYQRAIELDPNFATGYWSVGWVYSSLGEVSRASEYVSKAFQLREHSSEREKLEITADYYQSVTGNWIKQPQTFQQEIKSYPREYTAYNSLAYVYAEQGSMRKLRSSTGKACPLEPDRVVTYEGLRNDRRGDQLRGKGRSGDAIALVLRQ